MTDVKILPYRKPTLTPGEYSLTATLNADIPGEKRLAPSITRKFIVAGERLALKPSDVEAVFPPAGGLGDHSDDLPHIILKRSTLPWERLAAPKPKNPEDVGVPWLALLLFDENEQPEPKVKKLSELNDAKISFLKIEWEAGQKEDDMVTVIDVPRKVLEHILPTGADLKYLTHVRAVQGQGGLDERAVVVGNRLPKPHCTSVVHLVSMEGRYTANGEFNYLEAKNDNDLVRLVSLYNWRFACEDQRGDFAGHLKALSTGMLCLPEPENDNDCAKKYLAMGYTALLHSTRQETKTISWYHGPLTPGANATEGPSSSARDSDELLRFNASLGIFDVSYAAAWELGRFLALQSKTFSMELFNWKRSNALNKMRTKEVVPSLEVPTIVKTWFESLDNLKGVPFNYLVADERMLPSESIRLFFLDRLWLDCLLDGAFSIGRVTKTDDDLHGILKDKLLSTLENPWSAPSRIITGFLLRSDVVAGWPDLLVEGYLGDQGLAVLHKERLAKDILICLFDGKPNQLDISLKPEAMHFGVDGPDSSKKFYVLLNNIEKIDDIPWLKDDENSRAISISSLVKAMNQILTTNGNTNGSFTSAQFAQYMIEPVEKVKFHLE